MSLIVKALIALLAHAPAIVADLEAAISENWGQDHVQQAVKGVNHLAKIVNDVAAAVGPTVESN